MHGWLILTRAWNMVGGGSEKLEICGERFGAQVQVVFTLSSCRCDDGICELASRNHVTGNTIDT